MQFFTISTLVGAVALINALATYVVWRINPRLPGLGAWLLSQFTNAVAWIPSIIVNLGAVNDPFYTAFNNVFNIASLLLLMEGALRFRNIGQPQRRTRWIISGMILVVGMSVINRDDAQYRYLFHDLVAVGLLLVAAWAMVSRTSREERAAHSMTALYIAVLALGYAGRWTFSATYPADVPFAPGPINSYLFTAMVLCGVGYVYGLLLSVNSRVQREVLHMSMIDPLTGLANRRHLETTMELVLSRSRRSGGLLGVAFFDLDRFKPINDRHGHAGGDAVLVAVADRLRNFLRDTDQAARVGGDEFVVLFDHLKGPGDLDPAVARLRNAIEGPILLEKGTDCIRISLGTAMAPVDGDNIDALLRHADMRMYTDKQQRYPAHDRSRGNPQSSAALDDGQSPLGAGA